MKFKALFVGAAIAALAAGAALSQANLNPTPGSLAYALFSSERQAVSSLYGFLFYPSTGWSYAAATGGIANTTTAVTIKASAGTGKRNYITGCTVGHDTLGAATEFAIRDGAAGTVLFRRKLQTTAQEAIPIDFRTPLRGSAATLLEVVTLTAVTGGVFVNCQGYTD